eukprot:SAG31_NODE_2129_length_6388_cov_3.199396_9_plen_154_part_00
MRCLAEPRSRPALDDRRRLQRQQVPGSAQGKACGASLAMDAGGPRRACRSVHIRVIGRPRLQRVQQVWPLSAHASSAFWGVGYSDDRPFGCSAFIARHRSATCRSKKQAAGFGVQVQYMYQLQVPRYLRYGRSKVRPYSLHVQLYSSTLVLGT